MILVGGGFNFATANPKGWKQEIDDDRAVFMFQDGNDFLIAIRNGTQEQRVALTREAVTAMTALCIDVLNEGMPLPGEGEG